MSRARSMAAGGAKGSSLRGKKFLITSGPTCVSIDPMRVISNRATGELGQKLAISLNKAGAKVTLLEGSVLNPLKSKTVHVKKFYFFNELKALLITELKKNYDFVIHNAAVSDYRLKNPFKGKLSSSNKNLTIKLVPTEKLINTIKRLSPKTCLVGFKLEDFTNNQQILAESKKLFQAADCDMIVANTLKGGYNATILKPVGRNPERSLQTKTRPASRRININCKIIDHARSRAELTSKLTKILKQST